MKQVHVLPVLLGLLLVFTIVAINLHLPATAQARPLSGFTPTPEPPAPDDGGDDDDSSSPPSSRPDEPTDYVLVQMSQCDMVCFEAETAQGQPDETLPAYTSNTATDASLPAPFEIIMPVQLRHEGSGFITVGAISTHHSTRFAVPYPGRWTVLLAGQPQYMTPETPDASGTTLAQIQSDLAAGPVLLGVVEANVDTPQLVLCPILCVIETAQVIEDPAYLPETGGNRSLLMLMALVSGPVLVAFGLAWRLAGRVKIL